MYCKKCGKEITEDAIYCKFCGTRQVPQKIIVEFNKPLFKCNGDSLRSAIFYLGRLLKRLGICLFPLVLRFIIWGIVTAITWNVVYYGFKWLYEPPMESIQSMNNFDKYGVIHRTYPE